MSASVSVSVSVSVPISVSVSESASASVSAVASVSVSVSVSVSGPGSGLESGPGSGPESGTGSNLRLDLYLESGGSQERGGARQAGQETGRQSQNCDSSREGMLITENFQIFVRGLTFPQKNCHLA